MSRKPKIVLYQPQLLDPARGFFISYDLLPLEMLQIAALPSREGYEVVIVDANLHGQEEAHERALHEAEDAAIFGTTAILGYMVNDGHQAATKVRAAHPDICIVGGGWFPSCLPEAYLETGIYDAVCVGQGELTFLDLVQAVTVGEPLDSVPGLALWRDGAVVRTAPRPIVGWDVLPNAAWHLLDIEPYRERQLLPGAHRARNRMPPPPSMAPTENYFAISYFSSFGCPEPCTFCCSPELTERRWKAMPAERLLDDLAELRERWGFDVVRFQDANWGVDKKRVRRFCEGMLERDLRFGWNATIETVSILRYDRQLLDLLRDTGLYLVGVGGEASSPETMARIGKPIGPGDNLAAAGELHARGIKTSLTYIIGYPDEPAESMLATLEEARDIVARCPSVEAQVFPFRPIPGNVMYREAVERGYRPPEDLMEWGAQIEYHRMDPWKDHIPAEVKRVWRLYTQYASFYHGVVRPKRGLMERLAEWRIRSANYSFPVDLQLYYLYERWFGMRDQREAERQTWMRAAERELAPLVGG